MKCSNCGTEMHLNNNWTTRYNSSNSYFETLTLFAARNKNAFMKGTGFLKLKPTIFICTSCGKIETYLDKQSLNTYINIENDIDYRVDIQEINKDEQYNKPINLTRNMSRLRRKQDSL